MDKVRDPLRNANRQVPVRTHNTLRRVTRFLPATIVPSPMASFTKVEELKKGHVCPPSTAIHPEDRWETAFVYSFICKFTKLRQEVDGLETPME